MEPSDLVDEEAGWSLVSCKNGAEPEPPARIFEQAEEWTKANFFDAWNWLSGEWEVSSGSFRLVDWPEAFNDRHVKLAAFTVEHDALIGSDGKRGVCLHLKTGLDARTMAVIRFAEIQDSLLPDIWMCARLPAKRKKRAGSDEGLPSAR